MITRRVLRNRSSSWNDIIYIYKELILSWFHAFEDL